MPFLTQELIWVKPQQLPDKPSHGLGIYNENHAKNNKQNRTNLD